ncbi:MULTISPECIES: hypothetical protein [unclassified Lentimonas]|uniref:hypothetical protein n=1 Tax=unclassified Lentimonas TaxID=2630993 RepID=UPI0013208379|nr:MULTISPECIES: hypothetical protein [unclassified Lentimonas]CAA6676485.1 Unannotated [Lentimonas sp. CC4]CAA6685325.1 Unannotated [Lentimonas sp. CC6]CAA6692285.1 Unannotated [Lentimonas sp. CC19]CAA6696373.1 Unannotated [Lentimonas sp. CC10]CAA7069087.1 Unannotated [Lentimonas sp. CC11]
MMRFVSLILFLATAALCFFAGYKLGKESQPSAPAVSEAIAEEAPIATLSDTTNPPQVIVEQAPQPESIEDPLALRAKETVQTFFDNNDRKLVAEVLEVKADSLKVRRQADGVELNVPVSMLSAEDQAFAAYLYEQQPAISAPAPSKAPGKTSGSMEDMVWDELFK